MLSLIITGAVFALFGWTTLLRLRIPLLCKPGQWWFTLVTLNALIGAFCIAKLTEFTLPVKMREAIVCKSAVVAFSIVMFLNPQIKIDANVDWEKVPSKAFILINHTSWLDAMIYTSLVPLKTIPQMRTLLKHTLLSLPIGGAVFRLAGHFPVYYKKDAEGSWEIDRERQEPVINDVMTFMEGSNGYLSFFPEGVVNKSPDQLLPFRRGSFQWPIDMDLPIYGFLAVNNEVSWPLNGMPGAPADIKVDLFEVSKNALSLDKKYHDKAALAELCHTKMQEVCTDSSLLLLLLLLLLIQTKTAS